MAVRSTVRHAPFFERLLIVAINRMFEITGLRLAPSAFDRSLFF